MRRLTAPAWLSTARVNATSTTTPSQRCDAGRKSQCQRSEQQRFAKKEHFGVATARLGAPYRPHGWRNGQVRGGRQANRRAEQAAREQRAERQEAERVRGRYELQKHRARVEDYE